MTNLKLGAFAHPTRSGIELKRVTLAAVHSPLPLSRIALLGKQRGNDLDHFESAEHLRSGSFSLIARNTSGRIWIESDPALHLHHFPWSTAVARAAHVERLEMPWGWERFDDLEEALERWVKG